MTTADHRTSNSFPARLERRCGPVSAVDLALYAAASGDHNPLHLDDEVARRAGFDRALVHGMLSMAYAARLFSDAFGVDAVEHLRTRFTGTLARGATLVLIAEIGAQDAHGATYALRACSDAGAEVLVGEARIARASRAA